MSMFKYINFYMYMLMHRSGQVMLCLGPPESDWNQRNFQVTPNGCLGGRKMPENLDKEFIVFKDTTVSRRHFEISYDSTRAVYALRDLGSAGGSFVRIPFGVKKVLHPGMMLLMGKHQFTVSSVDTHTTAASNTDDAGMKTLSTGAGKGLGFVPRQVPAGMDPDASDSALAEIMDDAEAFIDMLEQQVSDSGYSDAKQAPDRSAMIKSKLSSLRAGLQQQQMNRAMSLMAVAESKDAGERKDNISQAEMEKYSSYSLTLTCFAPDASPMQGKS